MNESVPRIDQGVCRNCKASRLPPDYSSSGAAHSCLRNKAIQHSEPFHLNEMGLLADLVKIGIGFAIGVWYREHHEVDYDSLKA